MQRSSTISAAAVAGLSLVLGACAGESPTSPKPVPTPGGGGCAVTISLPAGPIGAYAGTAISVRAEVKKNGVAVPDNTPVNFTTDFGFFYESSLQTISKTTMSGVADVSPGALSSGTAHVRASFECASATVQVDFQAPPDSGPFISTVQPNSGSAAGGEVVVIYGGNFGTNIAAISSVTFGGSPVSPDAVSNTQITVRTPPRTLKDPLVPETVDVCVRYFNGVAQVCKAKAFTYMAINPNKRVFISSVVPQSGSAAGNEPVTIFGGNFGASPAFTRVTFCLLPATVVNVSDTQIGVLTPRASPGTCDVDVTIDLGKVSEQSAVLPQAFTFTEAALTPTINSISPRTGPNDAATRVTIFGTGFQFPEQVFMTGGACGAQRIEAPVVESVTLTNIVFQTPRAVGAYACLSGSLMDIEVLNPNTGKKASLAGAYKYYGCPSANAATPAVIPTDTATAVVVSGNNFEEPVEATFEAAGVTTYRLTVSSVSSTSVVIQMPPLATIAPGLPACQSYTGNIRIRSTALSCDATSTPITYRANTPAISSFSPTTTTQAGGASITVLGSNFGSAMTAAITKDGVVVGSPVVATVNGSGSLTFTAPFIPDSSFNRQSCVGGGTQAIPTEFGVRVTNIQSGCSNNLSGLVITPTNTACTSALQISTSVLSSATVCTPYSFPVVVSGGTPPYFGFSAIGLPSGLSINASTGVISGTPVLSSSGAGGTTPVSVLVNVQDTASSTTSKTLPMLFSDPTGPFSVNGATTQTVGSYTSFSVTGGSGAINWALSGPGVAAGLSLNPLTGPTTTLQGSPATGTYSVTVTATDSLCAPPHTNSLNVTVISP